MNRIWLWMGGIIALMTMGSLRLVAQEGNIFILLIAMAVVIAVLALIVISYMHKKW